MQVCVPLPPWAVRAGARENIFYNPTEVQAAIVTCGGLCPGLNDVVQGIVNKLSDYGVPDGNILGIKCAPLLKAWVHPVPTCLLCASVPLMFGVIFNPKRGERECSPQGLLFLYKCETKIRSPPLASGFPG